MRRRRLVRSRRRHPVLRAETGPHPTRPALRKTAAAFVWSACSRLLQQTSFPSRSPLAAGSACIWAAWRSIGRKQPAPPDLLCLSVATADVRTVVLGVGLGYMTSTCVRCAGDRAWSCRNGSPASPLCGKLSETTSSARSLQMMRPNPGHHQEYRFYAATDSLPSSAQAGSTSCRCRSERCRGRPSLSGTAQA